jgi:hypothetical protein
MALTRRKKRLAVSAAVAAMLVIIAAFGGCSSSFLPPRPTDAQRSLLQRTHFRASVGVEEYKYPVYSEHLIRDLRATGLFDEVGPTEKVREPDLMARVERSVYGQAAIPLWTILTLGIVPTTVEEEHGYVFSIRRGDDAGGSVMVNYTYRGPTTLGWFSTLLNLFPDRTSRTPIETPRFREAVAVVIATNAAEISKLLTETEPSNHAWQADAPEAARR